MPANREVSADLWRGGGVAFVMVRLCTARHALAADPTVLVASHSVQVFQSKQMSAGLCRLLSLVFPEAVMLSQKKLRRLLLSAFFGLSLSSCYYYAGTADVYPAPYYYPSFYSHYYYGGYYGPRYYSGYRNYIYGGQGPRYYGSGYPHWHH